MRSNAEIVDHLVDNLFRSSMINKDEFHRKAKQTIRKTFDVHLHPFSLNEEEKVQRTGLKSIMASTIDVSAPVRPMSKGNSSCYSLFTWQFRCSQQFTFTKQTKFSSPFT